jgi:hypothetical protein
MFNSRTFDVLSGDMARQIDDVPDGGSVQIEVIE